MKVVRCRVCSAKVPVCLVFLLCALVQVFAAPARPAQGRSRTVVSSDSITVSVLNKCLELSFQLGFTKPEEALQFGRKAWFIAKTLEMPKEEAKALENIGYIFYDRFQLDSARSYFEQALQIDERIENTPGMANRLHALGQVAYKKQEFVKALDKYIKALHLLERKPDKTVQATIYNNISLAYQSLGDFPKAVENLLLALEINEKTGVHRKKALNLANLGYFYQEMDDYPKALEALKSSLAIARDLKNSRIQALALINMGLIYKTMGDKGDTLHFTSAWECLSEALGLAVSLKDKDREAVALHNLAALALSRNNLVLSKELINQSIRLKEEIGKKQNLSYSYIHLASLAQKQGQLQKAITYVKMAIDHAKAYNVVAAQRKALPMYADLLAKNGQFSEAYQAMVQHQQMADSLLTEKKLKAIANAEGSYQIIKKQQEIQQLKNEKALQKQQELYQYIIVLLLLAGVTLTILLLRKKLHLKSKEIHLQKLQLQNATLEQEHLKVQLESYTLKLIKSNEAILHLQEELELASKCELPKEEPEHLDNFNFADLKVLRDEDWEHFKKLFESVYPTFLRTLRGKHPHLSANDIRLATLFRLGLNTREMASVLGIETDSVKKARHRLRKKLGEEVEMDIKEYFLTFS